MGILAQIGIGVVVFISTNVDDLLLLAAYFSDARLRPRNVVVGQFLGIGVLVLVSAVAALGALTIAEGWVALLGVIPLVLGLRGLHRLLVDIRSRVSTEEPRQEAMEREAPRGRSQVLAVAGVTAANGGDNLGVYIPLFANAVEAIPAYAIIFASMTALWCWMGYRLVSNRWVGGAIRRYGHAVLPFVLIGLGLYILADAHVLLH